MPTVFYLYEDEEGKVKRKPAAPAWLEWEHRRVAAAFVYRPGKELFINDEYNLWKGWGCEPKKGDITPWRDLLDYIFRL